MDLLKERNLLDELLEKIELPDGAYQKAIDRYQDIGEWLGREESSCAKYSPRIFSQGSFRLGTAIRPLNQKEEYDLDLSCNFQEGLRKESIAQSELKELIREELELYREARNIKNDLEEKHRCWRLEYLDSLNFHIDIIPCIPDDKSVKERFYKSFTALSNNTELFREISDLVVAITDDRHEKFSEITTEWCISNPEGYAKWFEDQMYSHERRLILKAEVEKIPLFKRKSILQKSIQLLKRHRDNMFIDDPDIKPTSIIITTLAARAYDGEENLMTAIPNILNKMGGLINSFNPKIPNPVNPDEDFADHWEMETYKHLNLEKNFFSWLLQAKSDFERFTSGSLNHSINEEISRKFSVHLDLNLISNLKKENLISQPSIQIISDAPPKPWGVNE